MLPHCAAALRSATLRLRVSARWPSRGSDHVSAHLAGIGAPSPSRSMSSFSARRGEKKSSFSPSDQEEAFPVLHAASRSPASFSRTMPARCSPVGAESYLAPSLVSYPTSANQALTAKSSTTAMATNPSHMHSPWKSRPLWQMCDSWSPIPHLPTTHPPSISRKFHVHAKLLDQQNRQFSSRKTPPTPPSSLLKEHLRLHWPAYAAVAGCVTLGGWYFYTDPVPKGEGVRAFSSSAPVTFSVRRSSSQGGGYRVVTALAPDEVDTVLRAQERSTLVDRPVGACRVARFDTNSVASNSPCEDKRAEVIVERDWPTPGSSPTGAAGSEGSSSAVAGAGEKGDLCFFAVMDGHAGPATSTLLAQKLIPFVALELDKLFRQSAQYGTARSDTKSRRSSSWLSLGGIWGRGKSSSQTSTSSKPAEPSVTPHSLPQPTAVVSEANPELVERALRAAFVNLDKEICATPVELLHEYELSLAALPSASLPAGRVVSASSSAPAAEEDAVGTSETTGLKNRLFPRAPEPSSPGSATSLDARQKAAYAALRPAMHGSCALLTYIDSARGEVYVACAGDSRAVGGYWDDGTQSWTFEPLSVDQTGRNLEEVARMRSEHPVTESDQVIMRGRVLGGLEPTRAFGDAVYKWDRSLQERLYDAFVPGGVAGARRIPRLLRTPPYVTADPLVRVERLAPLQSGSPPDLVANGSKHGGKQLRFIVMATDGLWDMLANEEVGALVAGHLAGLRGDVRADTLMTQVLEGKSPSLIAENSQQSLVHPPAPSPGEERGVSVQSQQAEGKAPVPFSSPSSGSQGNPLAPAAKADQTFTFADGNLSTHLIRNALGGAHRDRVAGLLAIPSPESRRYRDDMTVNVILFHDESILSRTTSKYPHDGTKPISGSYGEQEDQNPSSPKATAATATADVQAKL